MNALLQESYLERLATGVTLEAADGHLVDITNMPLQRLPVGKENTVRGTVRTGEAHAPMHALNVQLQRALGSVDFGALFALK